MSRRLLLHICCAGCYARTQAGLAARGEAFLSSTGFWFNPNIHPLLEYRRRLKALQVYLEREEKRRGMPLPLLVVDHYGLVEFCAAIHPDYSAPGRCTVCYRLRLREAARAAAEGGFSHFSSTLITSRHQEHGLIREAGETAGREFGVAFFYADLRDAEAEPARQVGVYKQQYCGCVFSEEERFRPTAKHLYRSGSREEEGA